MSQYLFENEYTDIAQRSCVLAELAARRRSKKNGAAAIQKPTNADRVSVCGAGGRCFSECPTYRLYFR
jgi:hypothetical protein